MFVLRSLSIFISISNLSAQSIVFNEETQAQFLRKEVDKSKIGKEEPELIEFKGS